MNYYIDCRKKISKLAKRCQECYYKSRVKSKPKCMYCGKILSRRNTKRCIKCFHKLRRGKSHPRWKGGKERFRCVDCGKILANRYAKRCLICHNKFTAEARGEKIRELHRQGKYKKVYESLKKGLRDYWKNYKRKPKPKCIYCGKEVKDFRSKMCEFCFRKIYLQKYRVKHGYYIYGKQCPICGKKIDARSKYCRSCARKKLLFEDGYIKVMMKNVGMRPNKKELLLNQLLNNFFPNEYKYVGDGQFWIENFNPDFINVNGQKKIIEFFGVYWHSKEEDIERDKERIETYKKYGYKTLVIWENELEDLEKVKEKIREFNKK